jgi:hypothetical protein
MFFSPFFQSFSVDHQLIHCYACIDVLYAELEKSPEEFHPSIEDEIRAYKLFDV